MILKVKTRKPIYWPGSTWDYGCQHGKHEDWPGQLEVQIPTKPGNYNHGNKNVQACLNCALTEFLKVPIACLTDTTATDPLGARYKDERKKTDELTLEAVARQRLSDRGKTTVYWAEGDYLFAFGPERLKLNRVLPVKAEHPSWAKDFRKLIDRPTFAGWISPDGDRLTALGTARLAGIVGMETPALPSLGNVIKAVALNRGNAVSQAGPDAFTGASLQAAGILEELIRRGMKFKDHPESGVVIQKVLQARFIPFKPATGDRLDAIAGLGWGRFARVQVESLKGKPQLLQVSLIAGSMDEAEKSQVIRADGGDVRIWIELSYARALESLPPPMAQRKRREAVLAQAYDDDDDDGDADGGNWPSTTGNPSGGGRGNAPPSR